MKFFKKTKKQVEKIDWSEIQSHIDDLTTRINFTDAQIFAHSQNPDISNSAVFDAVVVRNSELKKQRERLQLFQKKNQLLMF